MLKLSEKHPKCKKDSKGNHFFEYMGVWKDRFLLYKCSQCQKCVYENISSLQYEDEDYDENGELKIK